MPALLVFGRRTITGGDDLQPGCIMTIAMRLFQFFILILPISIHLLKEGSIIGFKSYFIHSINDSSQCRLSYRFPLGSLIYCFMSFLNVIISIYMEIILYKASGVGTPTEPLFREDKVASWLEFKIIFLNFFLFLSTFAGTSSLFHSRLYYRCLRQYETEFDVMYDDVDIGWDDQFMAYHNLTQNDILTAQQYTSSPHAVPGRTWLFFYWILIATQYIEFIYSVLFLVRHLNKSKGLQSHETLEQYAQSNDSNDHSVHRDSFHHYDQEYVGLYEAEALWEERCKFWCMCSGKATCFLFGGREVGMGDYSDIAKVLTDYFEHGGTLDIVPSDIVAALIMLRKIQKQQQYKSRVNILETKQSLLSSSDLLQLDDFENYESHSDVLSSESNYKDCIILSRSRRSTSSDSGFFTRENEDMENATNYYSSRSSMLMGISDESILIRDRRLDREIIAEGAHFSRHALGIYTWMLYFYMNPLFGLCDLVCTPNHEKHTNQTKQNQEDLSSNASNVQFSSQSHTKSYKSSTIYGDNCFHIHKKALLKHLGLKDSELIYAQFTSCLERTPYCIVVDKDLESVVLSIRGTLSLEDCVIDILLDAKPLDELGKEYGFDGEGEFIHNGILEKTKWLMSDLKNHNLLEKTMKEYPTFTLRIVGHSIGAGCAVLLSMMLRQKYPTLRCLAYSPPGGCCSKRTAVRCKDFVTSFVLDTDLVPRLSIENMEHLRNEILSLIGQIRVPKVKVLQSIFDSNTEQCIESLLYPVDSSPTDTKYAHQLQEFKNIQSNLKQQRGRHVIKMYPPGRIIHLLKTSNKQSCCEKLCNKKSLNKIESHYTPYWADIDHFNEIVISPSMWTDHFPSKVCVELEKMALQFGASIEAGS